MSNVSSCWALDCEADDEQQPQRQQQYQQQQQHQLQCFPCPAMTNLPPSSPQSPPRTKQLRCTFQCPPPGKTAQMANRPCTTSTALPPPKTCIPQSVAKCLAPVSEETKSQYPEKVQRIFRIMKGDKGDPGKDGRDGCDGRDGKDGQLITVPCAACCTCDPHSLKAQIKCLIDEQVKCAMEDFFRSLQQMQMNQQQQQHQQMQQQLPPPPMMLPPPPPPQQPPPQPTLFYQPPLYPSYIIQPQQTAAAAAFAAVIDPSQQCCCLCPDGKHHRDGIFLPANNFLNCTCNCCCCFCEEKKKKKKDDNNGHNNGPPPDSSFMFATFSPPPQSPLEIGNFIPWTRIHSKNIVIHPSDPTTILLNTIDQGDGVFEIVFNAIPTISCQFILQAGMVGLNQPFMTFRGGGGTEDRSFANITGTVILDLPHNTPLRLLLAAKTNPIVSGPPTFGGTPEAPSSGVNITIKQIGFGANNPNGNRNR